MFFFVFISLFLNAQNTQPYKIENSNWIATDAIGRRVAEYAQAGVSKDEKWVGLFYYIWHGHHGPHDTIYDLTKMIRDNPKSPIYGPHHAFHYWGEPEAGYYRADDPWVIRRNIAMMANAGVDFVYFDVTNSYLYLDVVEKYCSISVKMQEQGVRVPYICFTTNAKSGQTMNKLYDEFYALKRYEQLWFMWEGKPLVMGNPNDTTLREELKDFFTIKYSWAWTDAKNKPDHWQWIDRYPQNYGWSVKSKPDQIPVAVALHPLSNTGNSFSNGKQPEYDEFKLTKYTGQGLHFAEQWKRAFEVQPKVVMITQFNEWIAQRFITGVDHSPKFLGHPPVKGESYFVDAYNQEYNRDLEPMKDGHTDNLYYQMVHYIRLFKGMHKPHAAQTKYKISIDGNFDDWVKVQPAFGDMEGDTEVRDYPSVNKHLQYKNNSGRNDLVLAKVAVASKTINFYIQSKNDFVSTSHNPFPVLYLNIDTVKYTGWEGYDLKVVKTNTTDKFFSVYKYENTKWIKLANVTGKHRANKLEISLPKKYFLRNNNKVFFSFKWYDAYEDAKCVTDFFLKGDVAPDRRFDYLFFEE